MHYQLAQLSLTRSRVSLGRNSTAEQYRCRSHVRFAQELMLNAVAAYAKRGWPVLPCEPKGKRPFTPHGVKDATVSPAVIQTYWSRWPNANVGLATGGASGLLVIDVDFRNGGDAELAGLEMQHGSLPRRHVIQTGNGFHIYLKLPLTSPSGWPSCKLADGIDIKCNNGYVLAPPSIHPSGKDYKFAGECDGDIPVVPAWLVSILQEKLDAQAHAEGVKPIQVTALHVSETIKEIIHTGKPLGQRSEAIFSVIRAMVQSGYSDQDIVAVLMASANGISAKPREKGVAWLWGEIRRARTKPERPISATTAASCNNKGKQVREASGPDGISITYRCIADVESRPISWLWPGRVARGKVSIIAGDPGLGKSQLVIGLAATVTKGGNWPVTGDVCDTGNVILLSAEDDVADTIRPRLEAAGADVKRCFVLDAVREEHPQEGAVLRMFNLSTDLTRLEDTMREIGDVSLVIIDPITAYLGGTDSHKNADVRSLLGPLSELAARYSVAIVLISHLSKSSGVNALQRVTGSMAFVAAARAAYLVAKDPHDPARRLFLPLKNNIGNDQTGLAFTLQPHTLPGKIETSYVAWEEELVAEKADDVIATPEISEARTATADAMEWLQGLLLPGPMGVAEIERGAIENGFTRKVLRTAGEKLGIVKRKGGFKDGWLWSLPGTKMPLQPEDAPAEE